MQELTAGGGIMDKCPRSECGAILQTEKEQRSLVLALPTKQPAHLAAVTEDLDDIDAEGILEMARIRLDWVEARMDELQRLQPERDMLKRIIDAAKPTRRRRRGKE